MTIKEKLLNEIPLNENEVAFIFNHYYDNEIHVIQEEDFDIVDSFYGEKNRWDIPYNYIVSVREKDKERFFQVTYHQGLTENQENYYPDQVAKEMTRKKVISYVWHKKEKHCAI